MSESHYLLPSVPNFRDIGGLPTASGGIVRHGLVFRSGALDTLDEADHARLSALGLRICCDLRSDHEQARYPTRWPAGTAPQMISLAVATDVRSLTPVQLEQLRAAPTAAGVVRLMQGLYAQLPLACAPVLAGLFTLILDEDRLPLMLNCTAGKDRTGFVVAMLLHALGVPRAAITADYLRSNDDSVQQQLDGKVVQLVEELLGLRMPASELEGLRAARVDYLEAACQAVVSRHGSIDAYLEAAGLDAARRRQLQSRLLAG